MKAEGRNTVSDAVFLSYVFFVPLVPVIPVCRQNANPGGFQKPG
jgi:hypothetical protein